MSQQKTPAMRGFDAEFTDLPHYIRVITDRIWEGRRLQDIARYYSDPCVVETPIGVSTAMQDVIAGTQATLDMFPDRRLLAEDIIVSGNDVGGYLSSHRIISTMTHQGNGSFGPATNRTIHVRTIADCVCIDNKIVHEWLVRDQAAIAIAIGTTPKALAARWLSERGGWHKAVAPAAPAYYQSEISQDKLAATYAATLQSFAARPAAASSLCDFYDEAVHQIVPGEVHQYGRLEVSQYWGSLFSTFSVTHFTVEHLVLDSSPQRGQRIAMRWRAKAQHVGHHKFDHPTDRSVEIMGINHVEIVDGLIRREWVLIDEIALWMQVL